jgi:RHS repeat-associated protein
MFYAEDGQAIRYQRQPDGSYTGPPGGGSTFAAVSGGFELSRKDQVVYHFDSTCHLTWIRDRNSNQLTFSYGSAGWLTSITDTAGRTISVTRGASGQIAAVTLPDGRHVDYAYTLSQVSATDSAYLLSAVTDTRGGVTQYAYDSYGRLASITDPLGHRHIENVYAVSGRVTSQKDALDHQTTFSWDDTTQTLSTTDARGNIWKDIYANNQLVARTDPQSHTTVYGYGPNGNLTTITDPRGKTTTMTYDSLGNLLTKTAPEPLSYTQTYTYNAKNDVVTATDARGHITIYGYDNNGNLSAVTRPGDVAYAFGRDNRGLVTSTMDPLDKSTTIAYDSSGNPTSVTSPLGAITSSVYDSSGRLTGIVDPRGNLSGAVPADYRKTIAFNAADDVSSVTDALGNTTNWNRDLAGNVTSKTDPNSHTTTSTYNAANQLISVTAPGGATTGYTYDAVGNLLTRTDPNSHTTTFTYDTANRLVSGTTPTNKQWSYDYDENGNLTKIVDAIGNTTTDPADGTTTLSYDALNRLSMSSYSDSTPAVQYSYDGNGNRTVMSDGAGTQNYTYDSLDRLIQVVRAADTFSYEYDSAGHLISRVYPGGRGTTYTYNDDSDLISVTSNNVTTTFTYDVASQRIRTDLPSANGYTETREYDRAGRLTQVLNAKAGNTLSSTDYTYDPASNPITATTAAGITIYTYDNRDRLTEVCHQSSCPSGADPFIRYAYDAVGNRTSDSRPSGTTLYSYDAADQLTSTTGPSGTVNYSFDGDGNQTQAGNRSFTWNLAGTITSTTADGATANYSYDGDRNRLQQTSATSTTNYLWDPNNRLPQLALERNGGGSITRSFLLADDRAVSMDANGSTHYFMRDALGSVVNLVGSDGHAEWTYSYEPFGEAPTATQDDPGAQTSPLRFAGEQLDPQSTLYNLRARNYDTQTGRFLSQDPLPRATGDPSVSTYLYADDQPTAFVDPSGMGKVWETKSCPHWYSCVLRWAGHEIERHPDVVVTTIAVGCTVITGGLCAAPAWAGVATTIGTSYYRNVWGPNNNWGRFGADMGFMAVTLGAGGVFAGVVNNPFYVVDRTDRADFNRLGSALFFSFDRLIEQARP